MKSAEGQAQAKKINADADATVLRTVGEAEASKTEAVGGAEAEVIKLKIASMESGNYAIVQVAEALSKSGVKLVPDIIVNGGIGGKRRNSCRCFACEYVARSRASKNALEKTN